MHKITEIQKNIMSKVVKQYITCETACKQTGSGCRGDLDDDLKRVAREMLWKIYVKILQRCWKRQFNSISWFYKGFKRYYSSTSSLKSKFNPLHRRCKSWEASGKTFTESLKMLDKNFDKTTPFSWKWYFRPLNAFPAVCILGWNRPPFSLFFCSQMCTLMQLSAPSLKTFAETLKIPDTWVSFLLYRGKPASESLKISDQ